MPKRRRLLNSPRKTPKHNSSHEMSPIRPPVDRVVRTARGRLMGALLEVLEAEDSDDEKYMPPRSRTKEESHEEEKPSSQRQSYVLKLFDRSVDLSQFHDDSPLYPICRAWMANQPKANYKEFGLKMEEPEAAEFNIELPGPEGSSVSRIPELLPEQRARSKDNINLTYRDTALPSREQLLEGHLARWTGVRRAWLGQSARVEARYEATQKALNIMYLNGATTSVS